MTNKTLTHLLKTFDQPFHRQAEWLIPLVGLLILKLWIFTIYAPLKLGEYHVFDLYADQMASSTAWLLQVDIFQTGPFLIETHKMIGMSLAIFLAKALASEHWHYVVLIAFCGLSFLSGLSVFRLLCFHQVGPRLAGGATLLYWLGVPLLTDIALWSDGLYGPLTIMALCQAAMAQKKREILGAGMLLAVASLSRNTLFFLLPVFFLGALFFILHSRIIHRAAWAGIFILPCFLLGLAYASWNGIRTGTPILTTVANTALSSVIYLIAEREPSILIGNDTITRAMHDIHTQYPHGSSYSKAQDLVSLLLKRERKNHIEINRMIYTKYYHLFTHYPSALLEHVISNLKRSFIHTASLVTLPVIRFDDLHYMSLGAGEDFHQGKRAKWFSFLEDYDLRKLDGESLIYGLPRLILLKVIGYPTTIGLIVVIILSGLRILRARIRQSDLLILGFAIIYSGVIIINALSYPELRYLAATSFIPAALLALFIARYTKDQPNTLQPSPLPSQGLHG